MKLHLVFKMKQTFSIFAMNLSESRKISSLQTHVRVLMPFCHTFQPPGILINGTPSNITDNKPAHAYYLVTKQLQV